MKVKHLFFVVLCYAVFRLVVVPVYFGPQEKEVWSDRTLQALEQLHLLEDPVLDLHPDYRQEWKTEDPWWRRLTHWVVGPTIADQWLLPQRPWTRVAACVMAKDEEQWIGATLRSMAGVAHLIVLLDTGSTDRTVQVTRDVGRELGVPVHVLERPFVDFSVSRNQLLQFADGLAEWLVLLDANDVLAEESREPLRALFQDPVLTSRFCAMTLLQRWRRPSSEFSGLRIIKTGSNWHYEQPVHEYLTTIDDPDLTANHDGPASVGLEDDCPVYEGARAFVFLDQDRSNGGASSSQRRLARDLELLQARVQAQPGDPRAAYYLAQTLSSLGRKQEALHWFARRADMGGSVDERFHSLTVAGRLAEQQDDWDQAQQLYRRIWPLGLNENGLLPLAEHALRQHQYTECLRLMARACHCRQDPDSMIEVNPVQFAVHPLNLLVTCATEGLQTAVDGDGDGWPDAGQLNFPLVERALTELRRVAVGAPQTARNKAGASWVPSEKDVAEMEGTLRQLWTEKNGGQEQLRPAAAAATVQNYLFSCNDDGGAQQEKSVRVVIRPASVPTAFVEVADDAQLQLTQERTKYTEFELRCAPGVTPRPDPVREMDDVWFPKRDLSVYLRDWARLGQGWFSVDAVHDGFLSASFELRNATADRGEVFEYERWSLVEDPVLSVGGNANGGEEGGVFVRLQSWHGTYLTLNATDQSKPLTLHPSLNPDVEEIFQIIRVDDVEQATSK